MSTLLSVQGLSKSFRGLRAVSNVYFDVPDGGIVAIIGPNGAGKTTCFNLIAGALPADNGEVVFTGRSVTGLPPEQVSHLGIARTFQVVRPFLGMTVAENVMVGALARSKSLGEAQEVAEEVLRQVGLSDKSNYAADQLTLPDRKMLELARALASRPKLLMLDEVMAGMRPAESTKIVETLHRLNNDGLTILLIEHVMRIVMSLSHRVVVLHHGEKIAEGEPETVAKDPVVLDSYLGRKSREQ